MNPADDHPTRPLPEGPGEDPTEAIPEEQPTIPISAQPEMDATATLSDSAPSSGNPGQERGRRLGIAVLVGSILAAVLLCGTYVALGGLDFKPAGGSDPCDPRPWGSPQGIEETAERFSMAAIDGASCELGVSREELIRALADDQSRADFIANHQITDTELEDALRAGLLRATDDAERGNALSPLVAVGARMAIKVMPMGVMISLIDNATKLFGEGGDALDGLGGALDLIGGGKPSSQDSGGGDSESISPGDIPGKVGGALADRLRDQLPPEIQQMIPDDLGDQVEGRLKDLVKP